MFAGFLEPSENIYSNILLTSLYKLLLSLNPEARKFEP